MVVGQGSPHPLLFTDSLVATQTNWINDAPTNDIGFECYAKTRYRQPDQLCWVTPDKTGGCSVLFAEPQRAVTPGQSVVFYQGERCLGGGTIERTWNSKKEA